MGNTDVRQEDFVGLHVVQPCLFPPFLYRYHPFPLQDLQRLQEAEAVVNRFKCSGHMINLDSLKGVIH